MRYIPNKESSGGELRLLPTTFRWHEINPMERADLFRMFELGGALHPLTSLQNGVTVTQFYGPLAAARNAVQQLLGANPQMRVELCRTAAVELSNALDWTFDGHYVDEKTKQFKFPDNPNDLVSPWFVYTIQTAVQNFEAVFRAEMQAASTYFVPKRGTFSTRDLVDAFERSFLPELHATLGELALSEYRNAGRCFAFGLWTAAGYHSCRAVEAVLREYYKTMTGNEVADGKTWGTLIDDMEAETDDPKPSGKTIFYLRQLKDNERNPLMHVRVVLDEQDADLLLSSAKIVMVLMARELITAEKAFTELSKPTELRAIENKTA